MIDNEQIRAAALLEAAAWVSRCQSDLLDKTYVVAGLRHLATTASTEPASRGRAQGGITQSSCGFDGCPHGSECVHASPADAGGLTPEWVDEIWAKAIEQFERHESGVSVHPSIYLTRAVEREVLATKAAQPDLPAILFDGHAVYREVMANDPNTPRPTPDNVANVLDAVVRLIRRDAAPSAKPEPKLAGFQYRPDLSIRAVLYTDSINDTQVCRDDLWLATTADLNKLASDAATSASASPAAPIHDSDCSLHNEPAYPAGPCDCSVVAPVAGSQHVPEEVGGVNLARLLRNLEETSYNEGSMDLACRCSDSLTVIKGLLAAAPAVPVPVEPTLPTQAVREVVADLYLRMSKSYMAEPTHRITFMDMEAVHEHVKRLGIGGCLDEAAAAAEVAQAQLGNEGASSLADAYNGAREDLAIWKRRALEAEESCRRMTAALNAENGPTFMGEPADEQPIECWSANEEDFNSESLDELLECNEELAPGSVVWVGEAVKLKPSQIYNASDVIESMADRAYDIAGEYADNYPEIGPVETAELQAMIDGWILKHAPPTFYTVRNVKPRTLTADDFPADAMAAPSLQQGKE